MKTYIEKEELIKPINEVIDLFYQRLSGNTDTVLFTDKCPIKKLDEGISKNFSWALTFPEDINDKSELEIRLQFWLKFRIELIDYFYKYSDIHINALIIMIHRCGADVYKENSIYVKYLKYKATTYNNTLFK